MSMRRTMQGSVLEYLRHSRWFRSVFAAPLRWRRRLVARRALHHERYTDVVLGGELTLSPRNLPGKFAIPAMSHIARRIVIDGQYEPELTAQLRRLRWLDGDIVNVGANVGLFAVFFAKTFARAARVWAIEPNPEALSFLNRNLRANDTVERVSVIQAVVSSELAEVQFESVAGKPEYSSISGIVHPSVASDEARVSATVVGRPLRDLLPGDARPCLLFVDTEGAELLVFRGAEEILRRHHPLIVFECDEALLAKFGHDSRQVEQFLEAAGYVVRNALFTEQRLRHPFTGEAIALPRENHEMLLARMRGTESDAS